MLPLKKINYVLYSEVNPSLASHGGEVSLVEVIDKETAVLQFGGGCQGCGMVDLTLKDGVEKHYLNKLMDLKGLWTLLIILIVKMLITNN